MVKDSYEEYLSWEKGKNSRWNKVSKQIKPFHVIGILLLFFIGNSWVASGRIDNSLFWGIIFSFVILAIFLTFRETNELKLIPEQIIKEITKDALEKKRLKGEEIPFDTTIRVTLVGESIWEQDLISGTSGLIKREVGFETWKKGLKRTGVIGIHPYNGSILGIRWEKLGYTGKETKDRTIIPVKALEKD